MRESHFGRAIVVLAFCSPACGKKGDPVDPAPVASLAASTADSTAATWHYAIDPKSTVHVDLPGLKERIKADTTEAAGSLDVVPKDLAKSRGQVRIDLATFATSTFGSDKDATQTKHARTWLEVQINDKTNEEMRWAEFAIRSIDTLSAASISQIAPTKDGSEDLRTVTMTVRGELLVHGHKVPREDVVDVAFHFPAGAASDSRPTRLEIISKQPMRVVLKEHDVGPRDPAGKVLEWTTNLISKVADTADVTVRLGATPAP
ncbi:MAG TPA: YceI family protein [Polyangiaceae bacterium]|jgi:hypothetical protein|nr:YceI family protein [Polyangiaceae bacterium]